MAMTFPTNPSVNDEYTNGDRTWYWDGDSWVSKSVPEVVTPANVSSLTNDSAYLSTVDFGPDIINKPTTLDGYGISNAGGKGLTQSGGQIIINGQEIPGSRDLNTYRSTGIFPQNANADAASGTNYPVPSAGILQVINDDYGNGLHTTQLYDQYASQNYWSRTYYNGTWTPWINLGIDTWRTSRTNTVTLVGDVTGTASSSVDGSANWTNTITTVVGNDSHTHAFSNITGKPTTIAGYGITDGVQEGDSVTLTGAVTGTAAFDANGNVSVATTHTADPVITLTGAVTGSGTMTNLGSVSIATTATADPTLTLNGDVSGSATFTNLGNATLTVTVANDSHTHDGRYYTEVESDARFVNVTGDTLTGNLTINNTSPTVYFQDTDGNSAMAHVNSNRFYILRGANNSSTWTQVNGQWPVYWDLTTNDAFFGGSLTAVGDITAFSDERLKSDIVTIPNALDTVSKLRGVNFKKGDKASTGVIAQEVESVIPEVVHTTDDEMGTKSVAYGNMVGLLIEAIKELKSEVDELKSQLNK